MDKKDPEFIFSSICPVCLGPASISIRFCEAQDRPVQTVACLACDEVSKEKITVVEFADQDGS